MQVQYVCLKESSHPEVRLCLGGLGLGWRSLLAAALLVLNDGNGLGHVLNTPVAAVGPSVKLAVVVQVVLAVELILSAEFAAKSVRAFAVETGLCVSCEVCRVLVGDLRLLMALQVLVPAKCLCAAGVIALAHRTTDNVHVGLRLSRGGGCGTLGSRGTDLGALELTRLALSLVEHHLALHAVAVGRRRGLLLHMIVTHG